MHVKILVNLFLLLFIVLFLTYSFLLEPAPQYEELASVHQGDGVSFGRINCDDYSQYCQEKGVNGDDLPALLTSLHLNPWKIYKGDFVSLDTVDQFIRDNKPFRNTEGQSKSITSSEELKAITESKEPWFIKFYAPWCGHCKNLAPEWIQVANRLKNRVNVGEVNCDANKGLIFFFKKKGRGGAETNDLPFFL